jgi:beta-xylosidase
MKKINILFLYCLFSFPAFAQQLVLRGDYPDPSVVKIGDTYWATATTSNWAPAYPILQSKDLVNWKTTTHVFPKLPDWADYYFWAPEISYDNGKVYVYYAAHKKGGNLCLGVASADQPEGPYKDHGTLMCQDVGSIDAFAMRDEKEKLYMVWKEDANSVGKPTPIWAMEMNEERTALVGEKKELFRNTEPWEANLVEGVSMIRHGDYFYAFYAAAGCCGVACTYGVGIARAKNLLGPWEKYGSNPVLKGDEQWTCPGHGTPVEKDGKHYFMYHAYDKKSNVFTGRQGLLIEYKFTPDHWIEFIRNDELSNPPVENVEDNFSGNSLSYQWQWSVFQKPQVAVKGGELYLNASQASGNFIAHKTITGNYFASAKVHVKKSSATAGIAVIGDENNMVTAFYQDGHVRVVQLKGGKETELARKHFQENKKIYLHVRVKKGKDIRFYFSVDGSHYKAINNEPIDGSFLPPWDRAVRVGIVARGAENTKGVFDSFKLLHETDTE